VTAAQYVGEYRRNNFGGSYTTVEKVGRLLNSVTNRWVVDPADGTPEIRSRLFSNNRFHPVGGDMFRQVDNGDAVVFRRDSSGRVIGALFSGEPIDTYEIVRGGESLQLNAILVAASTALFGSAIVVSVISCLAPRWLGVPT
jgi:hypothetical protein